MEKVKEFIKRNIKIVIPAAILLVLILASVIYFISQPKTQNDNNTDNQTAERIETTAQNDTKKDEANTEDKKEDNRENNEEKNDNTSDNTSAGDANSDTSGSSTTSSEVSTSSNSEESSQTAHQHVWKEHTAEKWVEDIVTVVDQPERYEEYNLYRMYWYDKGTWEETRDPSRFNAWERDRTGGPFSPNSINMVKNPEDCPLFTGYNELGQPTYTGDHAIIKGLYDIIPAVTHEEDRSHYETYVDYYYCDCGAKKQPDR